MNPLAIQFATELIQEAESCSLNSYPDPASPLSIALSKANLLRLFIARKVVIPANMKSLSGAPYTVGWGCTGTSINENTIWTQSQADGQLQSRVAITMQQAFNATPKLALMSPEKQAAITSLVFNIGIGNYTKYAISKLVQAGDHAGVVAKFKQYVMAGGVVMNGLVVRREREAALYASVEN